MIIRGLRHPREVGDSRRALLRSPKPKERKRRTRSSSGPGTHRLPSPSSELKKSISMKMRYKMGLNKHAPSLSSATCLHRVASTFRPRRPPFLLALPRRRRRRRSPLRTSARPSGRAQTRVILKLFYLKFYNPHKPNVSVDLSPPHAALARRPSRSCF